MINGHFANCITPHDCWCEVKIYIYAFAIGIVILLVQTAGGFFSGSLSLLADTGHVLIDEIVLGFTIAIAILVKLHKHKEEKIRMVGGYINSALFFIIGSWILYEAVERLGQKNEIDGMLMGAFAGIGALGNFFQHQLIEGRSGHDHTVTHSSAKWHILSDLFQSIAVVVGAVLIFLTQVTEIDLWLSIAISALMFWWGTRTFLLSNASRGKKYHGHHHHGNHHH